MNATLSEIRLIALTVSAVVIALGGIGAAVIFIWKAFRWADARIDREQEVTKVLAEFPKMVMALTALTVRFENFEKTVTSRAATAVLVADTREGAAAGERVLQVAERARVLPGGHDG